MNHLQGSAPCVQLRGALGAGIALGISCLLLPMGARAAEVATAAPENASTSSASTDSSTLQEVIVTAQKRSERLQDVPLAVTAVSAEDLANRQINDTNSLVQLVPSLNYQQGNNPTNTTFRIRGVGTALFGQGTESSVSLVIDGVVQARQAQSFADLADIERIEVLEGPQGTLFGKNSTGGVINVVTAAPSHKFSGYTEATIAEDNEYRVKGTVTGPLSDTLAYRLSAYYDNVGGWIHDIPGTARMAATGVTGFAPSYPGIRSIS